MSSSSSETSRPTRESLLTELEDIKASLLDAFGEPDNSAPQKSPQAEEKPKKADEHSSSESATLSTHKDENTVLTETNNDQPEHVLPGQQSLFEEQANAKAAASGQSNKAEPAEHKHENPFLPGHVRARLKQNKESMMEDLADVGRTLAKHEPSDKPSEELSQLVDELVAEYLPEIENQLRERLHQKLQSKKES
ncbi:hypothetical protein SAMN02745866_00657 [Alteromonadaceae bacterium Bs31]|nr:hypothetical protein SAMN02745866_00657 [Alteromonadaceae bacterium Bs31]